MRPVTDRFKAALLVSHKRSTSVTCTVPGGSPVALKFTAGSVSSSNSTGARYQATLSLYAVPGDDTFALVSTPGAIFTIEHGIDYGAGDVELIDCGVYECAKPASSIGTGAISVTLVDLWQRVERCRFLTPYYPTSGGRGTKIAEAVGGAMSDVTVNIVDQGGAYEQGDNLWDRDRTQFIADMSKDGSLDAAFDASGQFRIRTEPVLTGQAPVWTFRTGDVGNIVTADRERPLDRLYNTVVVQPLDGTQSWDQQTIILSDPDHPRYPDKIGVVPFFYKSPTLDTAEQAVSAGTTIMQRVLGTTETVSLNAVSNPALEVGDVVALVHDQTDTDPGFQANHLIDSWQMDLASGAMTLATRSADLSDLEEG